MLLLAAAAPGSEDRSVQIGGRSAGGDAVSGRNVRFWRRRRRSGLLCDLHRRRLESRLRRAAGRCGLSPSRRAWCRSILLSRRNRLRRHGLTGLGCCNRGCAWCRLARTEPLGVEVGGRSLAGDSVHGLVRLLALVRGLGRRRVVRSSASGSDDRNGGERNRDTDAGQCAAQDVPPTVNTANYLAIKLRYGARKAKHITTGCPREAQNGEGPGVLAPNPSLAASAGL